MADETHALAVVDGDNNADDVSRLSHDGHGDTTWTKLFVGGLPFHTTEQSLREHFAAHGDVTDAVVITDRHTGKSKGYGFVSPIALN